MEKRTKIPIAQLAKMFPDNTTSEQWFINNRWSDGKITCPFCDNYNTTERKTVKRSWRCKDCRKDFSTRTSTIMHGSNLDFKTWVWAIYLMTTSVKGIASTKIASDLSITQKAAWHLAMRIREAYKTQVL